MGPVTRDPCIVTVHTNLTEYWIIVETSIKEPAQDEVLTEAQQKKQDEQKLKDLKAKNYLFQAIDHAILETILQKDTSKQIWDSMK
ncbi:hypothetical protein EZV62_014200 [Acer yangbiense]|uniref:Retrovirus-related Pol polyprotein from transposon TNT 1-94 n=1 Tax=Acer yangbiense TaxID=1000413 RepID=A0A5C7HRE7_9ROSI|nr:hypothetical protein EZV62_014200 [Acer yangbiense]